MSLVSKTSLPSTMPFRMSSSSSSAGISDLAGIIEAIISGDRRKIVGEDVRMDSQQSFRQGTKPILKRRQSKIIAHYGASIRDASSPPSPA